MKRFGQRLGNWLETHWVKPAYAGGLCLALSLFYFASATNTMSGWLYAISGANFALLGLAAILPVRSLRRLTVRRHPIDPVSCGERFTVTLDIEPPPSRPGWFGSFGLLQVADAIPHPLGSFPKTAIEKISAGGRHRWIYTQLAPRRGVYRWNEVQLKTAAPLGLFWCRRPRQAPAKAIVYPTVLPLQRCPLIDGIGREDNPIFSVEERHVQAASEGLTRALRPYRFGDPMRMIHWRTSARYGELRVRELEVFQSGLDAVIALDTASTWNPEAFEEAAIAAASLYFYASRQQLSVKFWSARTGSIQGHRVVLEALAEAHFNEMPMGELLPDRPTIWLTSTPDRLGDLPSNSRWVLWSETPSVKSPYRGIAIAPQTDLQQQLQSIPTTRFRP
ncbi:DUF58 domain-containing protein [Baaleninema simplex]|uniref:DUF58 domain-containing protein n=1 Tax=Baaleninema simplex TaxID=2862350 RepID=UPI0003486166|nr:DUF58 domain-containing protein [Baaleninema simplex]